MRAAAMGRWQEVSLSVQLPPPKFHVPLSEIHLGERKSSEAEEEGEAVRGGRTAN